jgi:hypothetical protein
MPSGVQIYRCDDLKLPVQRSALTRWHLFSRCLLDGCLCDDYFTHASLRTQDDELDMLAVLESQEDAAMTCCVTADRSFLVGSEAVGIANADMPTAVDDADDDEEYTEDEEAAISETA